MTASDTTPAPVATATPLDEMHEFLSQFVAATPAQLAALTLWVGHAHVLDAFRTRPRLLITSDAPGCGKSEALRPGKRCVAPVGAYSSGSSSDDVDGASDARR